MVFGIIPDCRSASIRNERSVSPESPDDFHIAGFSASANVTNVSKGYLGTRGMATGGSAGTIKRFAVTASGAVDDSLEKMLNADSGDPGSLTEFRVDVATSGDALNLTFWVP